MPRSLLTLGLAALATVADATTVAVLELGKGGVVHHTTSTSPTTSTNGVVSFWKSLHEANSEGKARKNRATQYPGMSVVPDLFSRPEGGVAIGIMGEIDLASMPTVAGMMEDSAVAQLKLNGKKGKEIMGYISAELVQSADIASALQSKAQSAASSEGNTLESVVVALSGSKDASEVDTAVAQMLTQIAKDAENKGITVMVHIVLDTDGGIARRRLEEDQNDNNNNNNQNNNAEEEVYQYPTYVDKNGNTVTSYRTMYQIQLYNITLWTAIGLASILFITNLMTVRMPLMPDTLLFGESAKMVAE